MLESSCHELLPSPARAPWPGQGSLPLFYHSRKIRRQGMGRRGSAGVTCLPGGGERLKLESLLSELCGMVVIFRALPHRPRCLWAIFSLAGSPSCLLGGHQHTTFHRCLPCLPNSYLRQTPASSSLWGAEGLLPTGTSRLPWGLRTGPLLWFLVIQAGSHMGGNVNKLEGS